jgi:hypothetical protein
MNLLEQIVLCLLSHREGQFASPTSRLTQFQSQEIRPPHKETIQVQNYNIKYCEPRIIKGRPFGVGFECLAQPLQKGHPL